MIYTNYSFRHSFNRVGGVDGKFRLGPNWSAAFQYVGSSSRNLDGSYSAGPASEADLTYESLKFSSSLRASSTSTGFDTHPGFFQRPDYRHVFENAQYRLFPKSNTWWNRISNTARIEKGFDHSHNEVLSFIDLRSTLDLKRQTSITPEYQISSVSLRPIDYGFVSKTKFNAGGAALTLATSAWKPLTLNIVAATGHDVNYVPANGLPFGGRSDNLDGIVTLHPLQRLTIDNHYILSRLITEHGNESIFNSHVIRSKWNYQFTRALSARIIGEYNTVLANPRWTSLQTTKQANVDMLLTYYVHPGTAIYLGYNSDLQNIDRQLCRRLGDGMCDVNGPGLLRTRDKFTNDGRAFFVKISYLFGF